MSTHEIIWRKESSLDKLRRETYAFLLAVIIRWAVTLITGLMVYDIIYNGWVKTYIIALLFFGGLAVYSWYVEYFLIKKHRRKYGRSWKWYKESLFKEVIAIVVIICLYFYLR